MPNLTVSITDAQLARILACGAFDRKDDDNVVIPATAAFVREKILRYLKSEVLRAESRDASAIMDTARRAAMAAEGW